MSSFKINTLSKILNRNFRKLGILLAKYPWLFIIFTTAISLFCLLGFIHFQVELNFMELFSIVDSPSVRQQHFVEEKFPTNHIDNFDIRRFSNVKNSNRIILTAKDGGNVLRREIFEQAIIFDQLVRNITVRESTGNGSRLLSYTDICTKYATGECYSNPVLKLVESMRILENGRYSVKYPFEFDYYTGEIREYCSSLGGVEVDDRGFLISAKALALYYFTSPEFDNIVWDWENKLVDLVKSGNESLGSSSLSLLSFNLMGLEMLRTALNAIPYFTYTTFVMAVFAFAACSFGDCVTSKSWLGIVGLVIAILSGFAGFGFCQYLRIPCPPPAIGILYVILGIGMDDVFVILEAWKRSDPSKDLPERMADTLEDAGPAITISSLTNFVCFLIGAAAPQKFSYYYCMYAAIAVLFDYVFTVSVVGAALVLMARAEKRPFHAIIWLPLDFLAKFKLGKGTRLYDLLIYRSNQDPGDKTKYFSHWFAKVTTEITFSTVGKCVVLVLYLLYIALSLWGTVSIEESFDEKDVFFKDSYLTDHYVQYYKYFKDYHLRVHLIVEEPVPYWEPVVQDLLENVTSEIENLPFMTGPALTESWIRFYSGFLRTHNVFLNSVDYTNKTNFISNLRNVYLRLSTYKMYNHDVVFNEDYSEITTSRILMQSSSIKNASELRYIVNLLRDIVSKYPFKMFVYHPYFWIADHLNKVAMITISSIISAIFIMLIISYVFIPNLKFCFVTMLAILSIQLGVMGFTCLWGVTLNNITNVGLITSVGFSIDNISHVLSAYYHAPKSKVKTRLRQTYTLVGAPILLGYTSSVIGFFALVLAQSEVYMYLFKIVFTVLTISCLHSIFILPIMLSIIDKNEERKPIIIQKALPKFVEVDGKAEESQPCL